MMPRALLWFGIGIVLLFLCVVLYIMIIPGQALAENAWVWPANKTPLRFKAAIEESGWDLDPNKEDYYLVNYSITIRSFLPFRLGLLHTKPIKDLPGVRVHALTPDFSRSILAFEKIGFTADFLIEIPKNYSPLDVAKNLSFAIYSGEKSWPRIPVKIPPSMKILEQPAYER